MIHLNNKSLLSREYHYVFTHVEHLGLATCLENTHVNHSFYKEKFDFKV